MYKGPRSARSKGDRVGTRVILTAACAAMAAAIAACGGGSSGGSTSPPSPPPALILGASPQAIASGTGSFLTWSSTDASGCAASGAWSGAKGTSGTESTGALVSTSTFTLTCTGAGGSDVKSATVIVVPPPIVAIAASPQSILTNASSTLSWSSTDATGCTASGAWSGGRATSG